MAESDRTRIRVLDCGSRARAIGRAAGELAGSLAARLAAPEAAATLLLSGGSALEILRRWCAEPGLLPADLSRLAAGLVDERWGPPGHAASNGRAVHETGFSAFLAERGASFREVLGRGGRMEEAARRYERWLEERFQASAVFATVGLGADGHTFGVLPQGDAPTFARLFPERSLFVAYEHPEPAEHRLRLTLTPAAAASLEAVSGIALGSAKEPVLAHLRAPAPPPPIHQFPAGILRPLAGSVATDR